MIYTNKNEIVMLRKYTLAKAKKIIMQMKSKQLKKTMAQEWILWVAENFHVEIVAPYFNIETSIAKSLHRGGHPYTNSRKLYSIIKIVANKSLQF